MRTGTGVARTVLLLGGTSDIGLEVVRRLVQDGATDVVLAARGDAGAAADGLRAAGASVTVLPLDLSDTERCRGTVRDAVTAVGDLDVVVDAVGVLGDDITLDADPEGARQVVDSVFAAHVPVALVVAARLREQGHGVLVVLSSFAAVRPRPSVLVYGAAKAGLDAFAIGLQDALVGSGARVMLVRPGFVTTSMTAGLDPAPFACSPQDVAEAVAQGLRRRRQLVWAPGVLRVVAAASRRLPRAVWLRMDSR